ncbi:MAG: type II toxin-antitoxin system VapC family toxin [Deltaproteobacteria bacterium]|nr:type II toxin-antitoxin system VapC family toxin [Deltaproteobacteria bacterium]
MNACLIDTDVLVDHLRGEEKAYKFLEHMNAREATVFYSVISKAEIYSGIMPEEEESVASLFEGMEEVPVDGRVAEDAGRYRKAFLASHRLLLPDALIAASAKRAGAVLVTLNKRHYPMTDVEIQIPYKK